MDRKEFIQQYIVAKTIEGMSSNIDSVKYEINNGSNIYNLVEEFIKDNPLPKPKPTSRPYTPITAIYGGE